MAKIVFEDFTEEITDDMEKIILNWLEEASSELASQTATRTRRGTGETAGAWTNLVDKDKKVAYVGNPLENAIWEEFGTGEFAFNGDGRKGGWVYFDESKKKYFHTYGKKPTRALHNAFTTYEKPIKELLMSRLRGL